MNEAFVDSAMAYLKARVRAECEALGYELEVNLIEKLSIPVQTESLSSSTGRTYTRVVRSKVGEYPRRDEGNLVDSIGHDVIMDGEGPDTIVIELYTTDPKARRLEGVLKRKLMGAFFREWIKRVPERLAATPM